MLMFVGCLLRNALFICNNMNLILPSLFIHSSSSPLVEGRPLEPETKDAPRVVITDGEDGEQRQRIPQSQVYSSTMAMTSKFIDKVFWIPPMAMPFSDLREVQELQYR